MIYPVDIYMTSWLRTEFTVRVIQHIINRTERGSYRLHVLDNQTSPSSREKLLEFLDQGLIHSLLLHSINTKCLWGKLVFHSMTESKSPYYVVTDNDVLPPKLPGKDWLHQMVDLMEKHKNLAFLTPQLPPTWLQEPSKKKDGIVYCKAVGNTLKLVNRKAYPTHYEQSMEKYGDDGLVSQLVKEAGWEVAFCDNIFCYHLGQTENWGYKPDEIALDPRKSGYGKPFIYKPQNMETFRPPEELIFA